MPTKITMALKLFSVTIAQSLWKKSGGLTPRKSLLAKSVSFQNKIITVAEINGLKITKCIYAYTETNCKHV